MPDLLIKNGTVSDGTGAPGRRADVGVSQGRITAIGTTTEAAKRTTPADGLVVSPGFIDPHTHYGAQICWDAGLTRSAWHGVTSVVMGTAAAPIAPSGSQ